MSYLSAAVVMETPLVAVGDVTCRAPRSGPSSEQLSNAEIVLPRSGVFRIHWGRTSVVAHAGQVVVLDSAQGEYRVSHPADGGDLCTVLTVPPETLEDTLGGSRWRYATLTPSTQLAARTVLSQLAAAAGHASDLVTLLAEDGAMLVLDGVARDLAKATPPSIGAVQLARVDEVSAMLAAAPAENWRLAEIARELSCSPFHLARQFRAVTGETIVRRLTRLRVAVALERLAAGEPNLARLATELGFTSHSHLTRRFRDVFGATPAKVRKIVTAAEHPSQ